MMFLTLVLGARPEALRFIKFLTPKENGCWIWGGGISGSKGKYGQFWDGKRQVKAHRFAWECAYGTIPRGKELDHICRQPLCCNSTHLELVTHRENVLRGEGPSAKQAKQTHCIYGHEFDVKNTYIDKRKRRHCRECHKLRERRYREPSYRRRD